MGREAVRLGGGGGGNEGEGLSVYGVLQNSEKHEER